MCRKKQVGDIVNAPVMIDGVWVETVVVVVKNGEYRAEKLSHEFIGKGMQSFLAEDIEFWKDKGYEIVVKEEAQVLSFWLKGKGDDSCFEPLFELNNP